MIRTDEQLKLAEQAALNLHRVLLAARKIHSPQDYRKMSEPVLLELQQRQTEILMYLSHEEVEALAR